MERPFLNATDTCATTFLRPQARLVAFALGTAPLTDLIAGGTVQVSGDTASEAVSVGND
jgi:hypothetical protein